MIITITFLLLVVMILYKMWQEKYVVHSSIFAFKEVFKGQVKPKLLCVRTGDYRLSQCCEHAVQET